MLRIRQFSRCNRLFSNQSRLVTTQILSLRKVESFNVVQPAYQGTDQPLNVRREGEGEEGYNHKHIKRKSEVITPSPPARQENQMQWEEEEKNRNLEFEWEIKSVDRSVERYKKQSHTLKERGIGFRLFNGHQILAHWFQPLSAAIQAELVELKPKKKKNKQKKMKAEAGAGAGAEEAEQKSLLSWETYLSRLSPEKLAVITMHETLTELMRSGSSEGVPIANLLTAVGRAVEYEYNNDRLLSQGWKPSLKSQRHSRIPPQQQMCRLIRNESRAQFADAAWTTEMHACIGGFLVKLLVETTTIASSSPGEKDPNQNRPVFPRRKKFLPSPEHTAEPAFQLHSVWVKKCTKNFLKCHQQVLALTENEEVVRGILASRYLPMVVKPLEWNTPDDGGYVFVRSRVMRCQGSREQMEALYHAPLGQVYESLNILSSTPWRINERMHSIITEAWEQGGGIADLPSRTNCPLPAFPENYYESWVAKRQYDRDSAKIQITNRNLHSLRCDVTYKLQVAKECQDKVFYFPHNMDFRGRTYPIPPHLNHLGQDLCRGLLIFAEGKPLTKSGLRWLKVHIANVYGNDKIPFDERVQFVDNNIDQIVESVENPLNGKRWWLTAEKPWQCLAASIELVNALKSKEPQNYISSLPVHQDGSCNGLQHYAALGGDELGARQVNLIPADRPQDVYSGVVELVVRRVEADAASGDRLAQLLRGKIDRKTIKQTVMTSVYGVTWIGARQQIENAMKDRKKVPDEEIFRASAYIASVTFASMKEMFGGAREIMNWLNTCARLIAKRGKPVTWRTPLGLPIVQPYRKTTKHAMSVKTALMSVVIAKDDYGDLPVNTRKHQTAFPPNYVHSLDSTHMMLTALECHKAGLTYASVHDSFWTHPASVDTMNAILRETFVDLHSRPLLQTLLDDFKMSHPEIEFPPVPARGNLDLRQILNSSYFFQ